MIRTIQFHTISTSRSKQIFTQKNTHIKQQSRPWPESTSTSKSAPKPIRNGPISKNRPHLITVWRAPEVSKRLLRRWRSDRKGVFLTKTNEKMSKWPPFLFGPHKYIRADAYNFCSPNETTLSCSLQFDKRGWLDFRLLRPSDVARFFHIWILNVFRFRCIRFFLINYFF